ncbi:phage antirepressor Ant [Lysinibacillus sp. KCTC 33748]|uniref:phage antirepressor n=1 Tax=unclassified Lysinibacillus TaxID=2636778 RepID=UPI0009A88A4E|nr:MULTISPECIES: phage antirepressor KilAC domain-containing protein [unclassified Lysinibacillus]OXS74886.1 phage antirepressor Ant [Lysinibacillus sp. KCTC 33748]SKB59202.1 Phage antirepressor protein YoqD, KilAC domain [Lysinibacillus sp. AC-3]
MNHLQIIYEQVLLTKKFKVFGTFENPLFLAKDVADWIEHSDTSKMIRSIDEDGKVKNNVPTLGGLQESWFLTEDGLYEILMQSRKPIAKQFKKQVKNILKEIRLNGGYIATNENDDDASIMAKALLIANKTIENNKKKIVEQQLIIDAQKPKVLFAEAIQASHTSILIGEFAKILKQNGVDVGQKRLFEWLRENGYLIKRRGSDYNSPTQKSMELGLFEIKETPIYHSSGEISISRTSKITGKGQVYFIKKFINKAVAM